MPFPTQEFALELAILRNIIAYALLKSVVPLADVAVRLVVLQIAETVLDPFLKLANVDKVLRLEAAKPIKLSAYKLPYVPAFVGKNEPSYPAFLVFFEHSLVYCAIAVVLKTVSVSFVIQPVSAVGGVIRIEVGFLQNAYSVLCPVLKLAAEFVIWLDFLSILIWVTFLKSSSVLVSYFRDCVLSIPIKKSCLELADLHLLEFPQFPELPII